MSLSEKQFCHGEPGATAPQAIKEEVKAYARDTGNELIHSLERKARENPLQAVAVAAGLAYPAWRLLSYRGRQFG